MLKEASKVLITGVAGFMGSHLADRARSLGLEVIGLDDFSGGTPKNLARLEGDKHFRLLRGDIRNPKDLSKTCKDVDLIFHFAAQSSVKKSADEPVRDFELNVEGTLNVLERARRADVGAVVFSSSSAVYGNAALPTPENHPLAPISNYGASKAAAEVYCSSYCSLYGLKTASLRYFNIFGPRSRKGVMFDLLKKLQKDRKRLVVLGTGDQTKDYLYVNDAIDATVLATEKGELAGEAYNVGSGENHSVKEIVKKLLGILGLADKTKPFYTGFSWRGDVQKTQADISKLERLGFAPRVRFEQGLSAFVDWYQSQYGKVVK